MQKALRRVFGKSHKNQTRPLSVINMNKKLTIALPLLALLVFGLAGQTFATLTSGVKAGDYFTYTETSYWESNNASSTVPTDFSGINDTVSHKATVIIVLDTNVTWDEAATYTNGTEVNPIRVTQDLDAGSFYSFYWWVSVIGANLRENDLIHPNGSDLIIINQTISRSYGSGNRDINVVTFTAPILDSTNTTTIGTATYSYYYDKATGILVENRKEATQSGESASIVILLKETNLWTVGEVAPLQLPFSMPILIAIIVVIIVAIVCIIFYKTRKDHRKKKKLRR
jgi:hypothetical protein